MNTFLSSIIHVDANEPGGCALFDSGFGIALVVVMAVLLLGAIIMPLIRRRGRNSADDMHSNLAVGDKVMTVCGIIGNVVDITVNSSGEKELTICTGTEGCSSHLVVHISGIYKNFTKPPIQRDFFGRPKPGQVVPPSPTDVSHDLDEPVVAGEEQAPVAPIAEPFEQEQTPQEPAVADMASETVATQDPVEEPVAAEEPPAPKTPAKKPTPKKK